jgi:NH3-dependent NAD+ synthetase
MSKSGLDSTAEHPNLSIDLASLEQGFQQTLEDLGLKPTSRIVIGVSGGTDSMALAVLSNPLFDIVFYLREAAFHLKNFVVFLPVILEAT